MPAASAEAAGAGPAGRSLWGAVAARPGWCYWLVGLVSYGLMAWHFSGGHLLNQSSRDLWQHLAALRALIENPIHPQNPFVATAEASRHFHPYWVSIALVARAVGWNEWQAIALGGYVTAGVLLAGIWAFGRAFYRNAWGPFALLLAMGLSWSIPISHTGYHSPGTLIEGMAYPAVLLVALSLLLWALVIRSLERPRLVLLVVPLTALMFATHQLGAVIGLIGAGCFALFSPGATWKMRLQLAGAVAAGLLLSCAWPYYNAVILVLRPGNSTWTGGINFYAPMMLASAFLPSIVGLAGLLNPAFRRRARPALVAFALFAALFAVGAVGPAIATRFVMPAVLMLQIGVAALALQLAAAWPGMADWRKLTLFGLAGSALGFHLLLLTAGLTAEYEAYRKYGSAYDAARRLTASLPGGEPVAAYDVAVWPMVATGRRALSVPWPEPGIADLAERKAATERLFDPALPREERVDLARQWGVRSLILDGDGPLRAQMPKGLVARLAGQSTGVAKAGRYYRFDLY